MKINLVEKFNSLKKNKMMLAIVIFAMVTALLDVAYVAYTVVEIVRMVNGIILYEQPFFAISITVLVLNVVFVGTTLAYYFGRKK